MDTLNIPGSSTQTTSLTNPPTITPITRPVTSKARGVCKYYNDPRGCYAKSNCKFLHADPPKEGRTPILTPYDSSKTCKFYTQGYCKRGNQCWFLHVDSREGSQVAGSLEEEDDMCSICFDKPTTYGLLIGCNHVFCIDCIKHWRDPRGKPEVVNNTKKCPMCRTPSQFITPSSKFWSDASPEKQKTINAYRESMSKVPCRYFQKSIAKHRLHKCPFGNACFYQHKKEDGTIHKFEGNIADSMRRYYGPQRSSYRSNAVFGDVSFLPVNFDLSPFDIATALDLNFGDDPPIVTFNDRAPPTFLNGRDYDAGDISGETMAAAFDLLRSHIRETAGVGPSRAADANAAANPNMTERNRAEESTVLSGEALMMMRLLDVVRTSIAPQPRTAPSSTTRGTTGATHTRQTPRTTTRNDTTTVTDGDLDGNEIIIEPIDESRASGYESEGSLPGLQSVSNSSDSENGDDDDEELSDDESLSGNEHHLTDTEQLFRQISSRVLEDAMRAFEADTPNPIPEVPAPESRPSSSARFSTVVERPSSNGNATPSRSASDGASMEPPMSLLQWAEAILQLEELQGQEQEDDDMPPLEPIPDRRSSSRAEGILNVHTSQGNELHHGADTDDDDIPPPLEPIPSSYRTTSTTRDIPSVQSTVMETPLNPAEDSPSASVSSKRSGEQDFTTDGRGRVISIGGPESSTEKTSPRLEAELDPPVHEQSLPVPPLMQRQANEFTTDGRGRVISVGDPAAETVGVDSELVSGRTSAGEREGEDGTRARGLFGWLGALF